MYWCMWGTTDDGRPLLENFTGLDIDLAVEEEPGSIYFEADLVTE